MSDPREDIHHAVASARVMSGPDAPPADAPDDEDFGLPPETIAAAPDVDPAAIARCAALDPSDTDNGRRLIEHFGENLVVVARDGDAGGDWIAWEGRYWDAQDGAAAAMQAAQKIGERIKLEVEFLSASDAEAKTLREARALADDDKSEAADALRQEATEIVKRVRSRKAARWKFAVSSKNSARVRSALDMAAPHLRRPATVFNADPFLIVANNATLRIVVEDDPDCPDPDVTRKAARVEAVPEFRREDYATGLVPCDYRPDADCPKWLRFLDDTMDDLDLRHTLQVYSATGMLGRLEQRLAYHYGSGANGKSVFLAVLMGVIGPSLCVGLPKETIMGQGERGAGQASPDLIRLFGKRMLRVDELKDGEQLREDLVKRLTGGDPMTVRGLYSGYLEFANVATPHMSGNGRPRIDGTDEGIWRRITVIHWARTIPEAKRRDFNEIVTDLLTERSGIFNWLLEGAKDYAVNGLTIAPSARLATEEYRQDQDPIGEFAAACLAKREGERVSAGHLFRVYEAWSHANARAKFGQTKFGREMAKRYDRWSDGVTRFYRNICLTVEAEALLRSAPPPAAGDDER
jgi:putative DNA primase/helicase